MGEEKEVGACETLHWASAFSSSGVIKCKECVWEINVRLYLGSNPHTTVFALLPTVKLGALTNSVITCQKTCVSLTDETLNLCGVYARDRTRQYVIYREEQA